MRFVAKIEYDGTAYHGWQLQKGDLPTVQGAVEHALSRVGNHPIRVHCAGRTDAGVHGLGQIIHFDSTADRTEHAWTFGANANLPHDVSVHWVRPVSEEFHARFGAVARRYRYTIYNHSIRPAIRRQYVTWHSTPLDAISMQQAAKILVGQHDFSAFRAKGCQAKSPVRTVEFLEVTREGDYIHLDIKANAFLHHMVRNIAGALMAVGSGKEDIAWVQSVLESKSRAEGGVTALSAGLCFAEVYYPTGFALPK
jgi:tRNA pseudouridine38-40 synthase